MAGGDMNLSEFATFLEDDLPVVGMNEPARVVVTDIMDRLQAGLTGPGGVPVLSGRLRASVSPFSAKVPEGERASPPAGETSLIQSHAEVEAVMKGWQIGDDCGAVTSLPYSSIILADGHSQKFDTGRLDVIIEEATR